MAPSSLWDVCKAHTKLHYTSCIVYNCTLEWCTSSNSRVSCGVHGFLVVTLPSLSAALYMSVRSLRGGDIWDMKAIIPTTCTTNTKNAVDPGLNEASLNSHNFSFVGPITESLQ